MTRTTTILGALFLTMAITAGTASADIPIHKANNLTVNPLGAVLGGLNLSYTRGLGEHVSLGVTAVALIPGIQPMAGVGGGLELFAWTRRPNNGFFVGAYAMITKSFDDAEEGIIGLTAFVPGAMLGYRWAWSGGFNLGLGGGVGYAIALSEGSCPSNAICTTVGEGLAPRISFDLGYAW